MIKFFGEIFGLANLNKICLVIVYQIFKILSREKIKKIVENESQYQNYNGIQSN